MRVSPKPTANRYSDDFRSDALNLVRRRDRTIRQLAEDLGVNLWTLRYWWRQELAARKKKPKTGTTSEAVSSTESEAQQLARLKRENQRLVRENDQLRMDREILKKAAAFFAKESE